MRYLAWIVIGAIWGVSAVVLMAAGGTTPGDSMLELAQSSHVRSPTLEIVTNDNIGGIAVLFIPAGVALDVLSWTLGVVAWIAVRGAWPGAALGALLAPHPTVSWVLHVLFSVLSGAGIWIAAAVLLRVVLTKREAR